MTTPNFTAARRRAIAVEQRVIRSRLKPPPTLTVSQWADRYRRLSRVAEAGDWRTDRVPYLREIMDACSDSLGERLVIVKASQVGATEALVNNVVGYHIHQDPTNILVVQPSNDEAEKYSKEKLAPMLEDTPVLDGCISEPASRSTDSTILGKKFAGGHLGIVGATSPKGLRSRHRRIILLDEVDGYPASAGAEGDPVMLAEKRATTYWNRKIVLLSTPTIRGRSRIEKAYAESDQRHYQVVCPHCGAEQELKWGGVNQPFGLKWASGKPETAFYLCRQSECHIDEKDKVRIVTAGRWVAENPGHPTRGWWFNTLISLFDGAAWPRLAREFLEVKHDPIRLRVFVNTTLAETWEDEGASVDAHILFERLGDGYPADGSVPNGAAVLTRSVDIQDDRLETAVWAWGAGEEGWLTEHEIIPGDPATEVPWRELDQILRRSYAHESGASLRPAVTFIDSGGHHSKEAYAFARARLAMRVFVIKGSSQEGAPLLGRPTRNNSARTILYPVGSFTGKESVLARFAKVKEHGPGYLHLPDWLDSEQLNQFTNEKLMTKPVHGRPKRLWVQTGRNEQLDLAVYALAALQVLGPATLKNLGEIAKQVQEKGAQLRAKQESGEGEKPPEDDPPPRNWVTGWRR